MTDIDAAALLNGLEDALNTLGLPEGTYRSANASWQDAAGEIRTITLQVGELPPEDGDDDD